MKKLTYSKARQFLHCKDCLDKYLEEREKAGGISPESPRDTFHYEASDYPYKYPDGHEENIMVIWCKTCSKEIWDSRHLTLRT